MRQKTTIRDLALSCGVAPSTVSRVLNNRAGEVGEETRQRILDAMRRMNYRPGQTPQPPIDKTFTLGIVSGISSADFYRDGYFHTLVDSLLGVIAEYRQNGLIFAPHLFNDTPQQSIRSYCDGRCDGLLITVPEQKSPLVHSLQERGFPLVLIGTASDDPTVAYCDLDNLQAVTLAMEELLRNGHCRIALCQGPADLQPTELRRQGYLQALTAAGIPADPALLSSPADTQEQITAWVRAAMTDLPPERRPTAIVCYNDSHAGYVLAALTQRHLRVPEDVSLIGIDDSGSARFDPPLTTIRQPYRDIARGAVEALLSQIRSESPSAPQQVLLPGELVRRASVAHAGTAG